MTLSPLTIGVEEEYLLVDLETRDLAPDPPQELFERCEARRGEGQIEREFLRPQIEIGTAICDNIGQVRAELQRLRGTIREIAADYGLAPIAASTHPFADWHLQQHTPKERYEIVYQDMAATARRLLICGMHEHLGVDDDELRIQLMNQFTFFLPHLLALSCSSPFWEGEDTGLKSYRLTVLDSLVRTRLPERFASFGEYQRDVEILTKGGLIDDPTKLWWDLRPSYRYPTLELRVMDVCTNLEHAVSIAALGLCLMRLLERYTRSNRGWRLFPHMLVYENRWRAMRYSYDEGMLDFSRAELRPFDEVLDELIELSAEDADALGCRDEVEACRAIPAHGTSAHRQLAQYRHSRGAGKTLKEALIDVVDWLVRETTRGS